MISLIVAEVFICGCIIQSLIKRTRYSFAILKLQTATFFSILACGLFYYSRNSNLAKISYSAYTILIDISLYTILEFLFALEERKRVSDKMQFFKKIYIGFVLLDIAFKICNFFIGCEFTVIPVNIDDEFFTWGIDFLRFFHFHLFGCLAISILIIASLVRDIIYEGSFNRPKYVSCLVVFALIKILNSVYVILPEVWIFDYSAVFDGIFTVGIFSFTFFSIPKYVKKNLLKIATENISDAVFCFDERGRCIYSNKLARFIEDDIKQDWINSIISDESDIAIKTCVITLHDEPHHFNIEFRRFRDEKNRVEGCYLKLHDCTNEVLSTERESYRATHDELTGLYNRNYFFSEMEKILRESPEIPRYLVCTDIKDFKIINDLFGSKFGDELLRNQAEMLQRANYPGVIHGRISGDKFAMLIPTHNFSIEKAKKNSDILKSFAHELNFQLVIYIGVYEITDPEDNVHSMYDKASLAIKNIEPGSNSMIAFYDKSLMNKLLTEKNISSEFSDAMKNKQFSMYLQPQIDVRTNKCIGAEALVRWNKSSEGMRVPGEFITVLEKSGQIFDLDYFIWEEAVKQLKDWKERGIDLYISVNISVRDFFSGSLFQHFKNLVEKYDVDPGKLNLEITESVIIGDNQMHKLVLKQLQDYGFKIEMDDFGSGYSSLSVLQDISMDVLKIDMEFLRKTNNERRGMLIISTIVSMAKDLHMTVISEGVETLEQAEALAILDVDVFQGFLYSKPIPVSEFEKKYVEAAE